MFFTETIRNYKYSIPEFLSNGDKNLSMKMTMAINSLLKAITCRNKEKAPESREGKRLFAPYGGLGLFCGDALGAGFLVIPIFSWTLAIDFTEMARQTLQIGAVPARFAVVTPTVI